MDDLNSSDLKGSRKSERKKKLKRSFSPDPETNLSKLSGQVVKKKKKASPGSAFAPDRLFDRLPNGMPFRCDLCKSSYVCNPMMSKRALRVKRSKHMPSPRYKTDEATGKTLTLCNACGIALDRPKRPKKQKHLPTQEEKDKYLLESKLFASNLAAELQMPEADVLYCPAFKTTPCRCLQEYLTASDKEQVRKRAEDLCFYHKEASRLSALKYYDVEKVTEPGRKGKRARNIGLGNGQKKSAVYELFVLQYRELLRYDMMLCERATQKILRYSNNFLHKKLKTEERGCRAQRVKGKAALGLLRPLEQLHKEKCCIDNCVRMSLSHCRLLEQWRDRAISGQQEARRVLAEMLTPSGGVRSNCYKFITWVTGCSASTIGKVNDQMKQTGGEREPPQHGLRKYWMNNPRRGAASETLSQAQSESVQPPSPVTSPPTTPDSVQLPVSSSQLASAPSTHRTTSEGLQQQQMIQQQTELLKVLEQKLMQTQRMQESLMQMARPDVAQNVASVQGMFSQLNQMQAAVAAQTPGSQRGQSTPQSSIQGAGPQASIQIGATQANSNHPQTSTIHIVGPQTILNHPQGSANATQTFSHPKAQYQTQHHAQTDQHSNVSSDQLKPPVHHASCTQGPPANTQPIGVANHPQFAGVQVPVLNPQPSVVHLQSPSIQIKLTQPQYIIQASPTKANNQSVLADHEYVMPARTPDKPKMMNILPGKEEALSNQDSGVSKVVQNDNVPQQQSSISRLETVSVNQQNVRPDIVAINQQGTRSETLDVHQQSERPETVSINQQISRQGTLNVHQKSVRPETVNVQQQSVRPETVNVHQQSVRPEIVNVHQQRSEPVSLVKIGNQIHQIVNLPQAQPQVIMQPVQLQSVRPSVGLRVPVIQHNQLPQVQTTQEQILAHDGTRHQIPHYVTLPLVNPEQMQPKGVQNICVPSRLPIGSPITVQQLQQMMLQSQRVQQEAAVQQQKPDSAFVNAGPASSASKETSASSITHNDPAHAKPVVVQNVSSNEKGAKDETATPQIRDSASDTENAKRAQPPFNTRATETPHFNAQRNIPIEHEVRNSFGVQQHETSAKLNLTELENHALVELGHLPNAGEGQDQGQGQHGMNCALLVQSVPNSNSESVISSGHQTPSNEVDEMLRSFYINRHSDLDLISPLTLPDNLTRSRNNSGESTIEPTVSVDLASLPRELLSYFTQQGVTITISNGQSHQNGQSS